MTKDFDDGVVVVVVVGAVGVGVTVTVIIPGKTICAHYTHIQRFSHINKIINHELTRFRLSSSSDTKQVKDAEHAQ